MDGWTDRRMDERTAERFAGRSSLYFLRVFWYFGYFSNVRLVFRRGVIPPQEGPDRAFSCVERFFTSGAFLNSFEKIPKVVEQIRVPTLEHKRRKTLRAGTFQCNFAKIFIVFLVWWLFHGRTFLASHSHPPLDFHYQGFFIYSICYTYSTEKKSYQTKYMFCYTTVLKKNTPIYGYSSPFSQPAS